MRLPRQHSCASSPSPRWQSTLLTAALSGCQSIWDRPWPQGGGHHDAGRRPTRAGRRLGARRLRTGRGGAPVLAGGGARHPVPLRPGPRGPGRAGGHLELDRRAPGIARHRLRRPARRPGGERRPGRAGGHQRDFRHPRSRGHALQRAGRQPRPAPEQARRRPARRRALPRPFRHGPLRRQPGFGGAPPTASTGRTSSRAAVSSGCCWPSTGAPRTPPWPGPGTCWTATPTCRPSSPPTTWPSGRQQPPCCPATASAFGTPSSAIAARCSWPSAAITGPPPAPP